MTTTLLRAETGVGRLRSMQRLGAESPHVEVRIDTPDGLVGGFADVRHTPFDEMFAESVAVASQAFVECDVWFRVEVRRSRFADPSIADADLGRADQRRWLVDLRLATPDDNRTLVVEEMVDSVAARAGRALTTALRMSFIPRAAY